MSTHQQPRAREAVDVGQYISRTRTGPCFICEMLAGNPNYRHHVVYDNDVAVAFLDKFPTLVAHVLVAPKRHVDHVTAGFGLDEYLELQRIVYRIAEAVRRAVPTERMYIYSLGSQQGNSHVHWHLAPLPPGVPYEQQQFQALMMENGILNVSDQEMATIASRIVDEINHPAPEI